MSEFKILKGVHYDKYSEELFEIAFQLKRIGDTLQERAEYEVFLEWKKGRK